MARKRLRDKELKNLKKAREIKQKKRKPGSDDTPKGDDDACAFCDNGGYVTCCDGGCLRSFHLGDKKREDLQCRLAVGVTKRQAKMINEKEEIFLCKNCKYKQHQCFVCGLLGSSDLSSRVEDDQVFQCEHEDCGYFYHAKCVAELLYPESEKAILFEEQVTARVGFFCPRHECSVCKEVENKDDLNMQFAVCRRCPTVYHRECLPSDILFDPEDGSFQRAWDGIIRHRILIYCTKHEIIEELKTPARNHIVFPDAEKLRVPKIPEGAPMEQDILEEEERNDHPSSEQSQPPPAAKNQEQLNHTLSEPSQAPPAARDQCSCCGPFDSFAPKALFMHPQPGSCGWLDD